MVKEPYSGRGVIIKKYQKKVDIIDLIEFFYIINYMIENTFVFEKASERQRNYLMDMGFKNLKEILFGIERSEVKMVALQNIENDLTATVDCLRYDSMVNNSQKFNFLTDLEKSLYSVHGLE